MSASRVQMANKPTSPRTGIGRYAVELERGLRAESVDVRLAPLRTPVPRAISRLARHAGYDLNTFFQSYPLRVDAWPGWITHLTSQTLGVLLLTQRLPRPVVVTVHDILPYSLRDDPKLSAYLNQAQRLMDALAMRGLRRADRLIADSHYTKATIVESLGFQSERVDVVHLGVDTQRFRPQPVPASFLERYGISSDGQSILYVGSEHPRKSFGTLLRAFARIRREFDTATLLKVGWAGSPEYRERSTRLCEELGITRSVRWFDDVSDDDLPLFYNVADVFALPSHYEGFGFPVLEAMACGTPVVAFRAASIPEIAGDLAVLVDDVTAEGLATGLVRSITGDGMDYTLGIRHASRFSWTTTATRTNEIYDREVGMREGTAWTSAL